jgi:hypothetical protein
MSTPRLAATAQVAPETGDAWAGWWKAPQGRWTQLTKGASEAEALDALLDRMGREYLAGGLVVLPVGQHPSAKGGAAAQHERHGNAGGPGETGVAGGEEGPAGVS